MKQERPFPSNRKAQCRRMTSITATHPIPVKTARTGDLAAISKECRTLHIRQRRADIAAVTTTVTAMKAQRPTRMENLQLGMRISLIPQRVGRNIQSDFASCVRQLMNPSSRHHCIVILQHGGDDSHPGICRVMLLFLRRRRFSFEEPSEGYRRMDMLRFGE